MFLPTIDAGPGIAHLWFIMIQPFDDGNGRVGRAVTDYIMSINYPSLMHLISFSKHFSLDRKGYYSILEKAGKKDLNITECSKVTASRDLADLLEKGILQKTNAGGRSTGYDIYLTNIKCRQCSSWQDFGRK